MEHEPITELSEKRFADADLEQELLPTLVASTLRSQTGAAIVDLLLSEVMQRLDYCAGRAALEGGSAVVRNGYHKERTVLKDSDPVSVRTRRIRNRDGKRESFASVLIKPFGRRTRHMDEMLAYTRLRGVSQCGWRA